MVWPVSIDPAGETGPTRGRAAGPGWRRTGRGLYVPARVDPRRTGQRIAEAFARSGGGGIVTGWASLWLHRAAYFDGLLGDGRTTTPVPLLEHECRLRGTADVQVIRRQIPDGGHTMPGAHGSRLAREPLLLADERSASPQESRFRFVWQVTAGWPRPLVNRDILDLDGRFIGRPDLFDPDRSIVGEFAGAVHRDRARHRNDVRREDLFRRAGLEYVEVVGADLHDTRLVLDRMHAAAARAGSQPQRWQLGLPPAPLDDILDDREFMIALHEGSV